MAQTQRPRPATPPGRDAALPALPSGFDAFLHSAVGGRDGPEVSVLSMLARQGLDPWAEAERLSRGSGAAAVRALSEAIAALPGPALPGTGPSRDEATARALRLLPLLGHSAPAARYLPAAGPPRRRATVLLAGLVGAALALAILLLDLPG